MNHLELAICRGVQIAPQDDDSAEEGSTSLTLLANGSGFALDPLNDWQPAMAQRKPGVWGESGVADGRTLITQPIANVIETINVVVTAQDWKGVYEHLGILNRLAEFAVNFWQKQTEDQPVYLKWKPDCASGPQFALIYSMDISPSAPIDSNPPQLNVVIVLEREPFWRWEVEPGGNPKKWTLRDAPLDSDDFSLYTGTNHLVVDNVSNKIELDSTDYSVKLSNNHTDIDAALIPGDAPALLCVAAATTAGSGIDKIWMSKSTTPVLKTSRAGNDRAQVYLLNTPDAGGTPVVGGVGYGVLSNGSNVVYYYSETTLAGLASGGICAWDPTGIDHYLPDMNLTQGTFAVFLRHNLIDGVTGDIVITAEFGEGEGAVGRVFIGDNGVPAIRSAGGAAGNITLAYIGQITLPLTGHLSIENEGRGMVVSDNINDESNLYIRVNAENKNAAARTIRYTDLILIPIDEGMALMTNEQLNGQNYVTADNTGYMTHGKNQVHAFGYEDQGAPTPILGGSLEYRGEPLYLTPNVDNRLHFLWAQWDVSDEVFKYLHNSEADIRINIVPRSYGPRWL